MADDKRSRSLPVVTGQLEGLGEATIMDALMAAKWGVPYVHLAAVAIDVDRVRGWVESDEEDPQWPFGWETVVTERFATEHLDPERDEEMMTEVVASVIDAGAALGAQLPFALYDAVYRGAWPRGLLHIFPYRNAAPRQFCKRIAGLYDNRCRDFITLLHDFTETELLSPVTTSWLESQQTSR